MAGQDFFLHWFDKNKHKFMNPAVYLGTEPGSEIRPWEGSPLNICVVAASTYDNLTGNLASPILTRMLLEADPNWVVERAFFPNGRKDLELFEKNKIPVFSLESKKRLSEFDVLCVSCSFQGLDLNVIKILDLCKIPILQADRAEVYRKDNNQPAYPWIIRGGQNDSNPSPFMGIYDICYIGEAEVNLLKLLRLMAKAKKEGIHRSKVKRAASAKLDGCLVPEFYEPHYNKEKPWLFEGWTTNWEGAPLPVKAARIKDLNKVYIYRHPIMNYTESMGAGEILISKGCQAKCNFAVSGDTWVVTNNGLGRIVSIPENVMIERMTFPQHAGKVVRGVKELYEVTLGSGLKFKLTEEHESFGWSGSGELDYFRADSLRLGDYVAASLKRRFSREFDAEAWLLGFFVGDGGVRSDGNGVYVCLSDKYNEEGYVTSLIQHLYEKLPTRNQHSQCESVCTYWFSNHPFRHAAENWRGIIQSSPNKWFSFLGGLLQADGWRSSVSSYTLCTVSADLAEMVAVMGRFLGIYTTIRDYDSFLNGEEKQRRYHVTFQTTEFLTLKREVVSDPTDLNRGKGSQNSYKTRIRRHRSDSLMKEHSLILEKVVSIKRVPPETVYDVVIRSEVDNLHKNFIGNGFVLHNCNEGWKEKPYREMDPDIVVEAVKQNMIESGSADVVLSAFCVSSYRLKKYVMKRLMEEVSPHVGLTSQRADESAEDPEFMKWTAQAGNRSVSFGVEGMSARLRALVSKHATVEQICQAVDNALAGGYNKIKLFCIANLPTECEADREEWLELARAVKVVRDRHPSQKCQIKFQFTDITITPWTPFQWNRPTQGARNLSPYLKRIKEESGLRVSFGAGKGHALDSLLQILYLSDPRMLPILIRMALYHGIIYFRQVQKNTYEIMKQEIEAAGMDYEWFWRERTYEENLPWEIITYGMKKSYLWKVWQRALKGEQTPKCNMVCEHCGALGCEGQLLPLDDKVEPPKQMQLIPVDQHLIIKLNIDHDHRFVPASARKQLVRRALYMQDIPIMREIEVVSDTFRNEDWVGGYDYAAVRLTRKLSEPPVLESLTKAFTIESVQLRTTRAARLFVSGVVCHSKIKLFHPVNRINSGIKDTMGPKNATISVRVTTQMGTDTVKLKVFDVLKDLWLQQESDGFYLHALHDGGVSINDIYHNVVKLRSWTEVAGLPAERVEVYVLGQELGSPRCPSCSKQKMQTVSGDWVCPRCQHEQGF